MSATELREAYSGLRALSDEGSTERARWDAAISAFANAVQRCEDAAAIEAILDGDTYDELPAQSKTLAFERRLDLGPRSPAMLRQYADHLWLHGPADDDKVETLRAEADVIEESADAVADAEVETVWHFQTRATFEATRDLVFQALSEAPHLEAWLAAPDQSVVLGIDDGARTVRVESDDGCRFDARITSMLAPNELTADVSWRTATWQETRLQVTVALDAPSLTETDLTSELRGFRDDDAVDEARDLAEAALDRLGRHLGPRAEDALDDLTRTAPLTTWADIGRSLNLRAPDGSAIRVEAQRLAWTTVEGRPVECRLRLSVMADDYATIDQRALFHLEPEARQTPFGGTFEPTEAVRLDVQLDPDLLGRLADQVDSAESAAQLLLAEDAGPLAATDSWYALSISQPSGPVNVGFQTTWARTLRTKRPIIGTTDR